MVQKFELLTITFGAAITGTVAPFAAEVVKLEIPLIVMQVFQLISYSTAITIGCLTLYKFYKNR